MGNFSQLLEYTYSNIMRKQKSITKLFPTFYDRVKNIGGKGGVRLEEMRPEDWHFKVASGTKDDVSYDVYIKYKNVLQTIQRFVPNQKLWNVKGTAVDYRKLAAEVLNAVDFETSCSCPASLYWGKDYIRTGKDAQYGRQEFRPPNIRNPKQYGALCFDNKAKVLVEDGTYKNIIDIKVGDKVFTHTGKLSEVTEVFVRETSLNNMYEVNNYGSFGVTSDHEFFVLKSGVNNVDYYRRTFGLKRVFKSVELIWTTIEEIFQNRQKFLFFHPKLDFGNIKSIRPDLARLLGYYLAEGNLSGYNTLNFPERYNYINRKGNNVAADSINFTLSSQEENTLLKDILEIISYNFKGIGKTRFCPHERGEGYLHTYIRNIPLAKFCGRYCGTIHNKKLHPDVFKWDINTKLNFLLGAFLGDGYRVKNCKQGYISTTIKTLAEQLSSLLGSLNVPNSIQVINFKGIISYRVYFDLNVMPRWFIEECKKLGKTNFDTDIISIKDKFNMVVDGGVYKTIKEIKKLQGKGKVKVYNLEVKSGDHSYIVNGVSVHNCKHGELVFEVLPVYTVTFASYLKKFFSAEVEAAFAAAQAETAKFKKAGEELGKLAPEPTMTPTQEEPIEEPTEEEVPLTDEELAELEDDEEEEE